MTRGNLRISNRYKWLIFDSNIKGESFVAKQPYSDLFWRSINHLKSRGFECSLDPIYEEYYKAISKYHRIAKHDRKQIIVLFEISAIGFSIKFGHYKNYPLGNCSSDFVSYYLDQYKPLSYLERKCIELEMSRMQDFLSGLNVQLIPDEDDLSPENQIIIKNQRNKHVHGDITSLEEIQGGMSDYDLKHNNNDANRKKIKCGDLKYFYGYHNGRRLSRGIVYHNINNMWWVLAEGKKFNIASFRLFDFDEKLPRKQPSENQENKLQQLIKQEAEKMNFERCIALKKALSKAS